MKFYVAAEVSRKMNAQELFEIGVDGSIYMGRVKTVVETSEYSPADAIEIGKAEMCKQIAGTGLKLDGFGCMTFDFANEGDYPNVYEEYPTVPEFLARLGLTADSPSED